MRKLFYLLLLFPFVFDSCKKCDDKNPTTCESNHRPVVFMHGFLASGDTWANQVMRFTTNGYCENLLFAFDWNTLSQGNNNALLNAFIDSVLNVTGATQVDLVGHSAGGGLGYGFCEDSARAAKVAHYVHIGSSSQSSPAGVNDEVPTLCISSPDDKTAGNTTITGATNITLYGTDHYQVATCAEAFLEMYKFFNDGKSANTATIKELNTEIKISGKVLALGENTPLNGAIVKVYEVNAANAERVGSTPAHTLTADKNGFWGPVNVKKRAYYEFEVTNPNSSTDRKIYYFREGFIHHNPLVYLRTLPSPTSLAGVLLSSLPSNDNQSVLAVFTSNQATVAGRDSLFVDNVELSTQQITPASATVIAMFLYDDNNNQQTDLTKPAAFGFLNQFLSARDMFFQTSTPSAIPLRFNGRTLHVRNLKSQSEGVIVAVLD
ncbi:MAG: hypothetical protein KIS94_01960 [Chitinophagales bacterium]|nr:hypothetical protein [Chitinophagales bacterium]